MKTKIMYFKNVKNINFSERKFYVLPLCHIAFYFLSVVRTNYLSIFEQGKVKPCASSPPNSTKEQTLSFNNIFKIFVTFSTSIFL